MMTAPTAGIPMVFPQPGGIMPMNMPQGMSMNYPLNNNLMNQMPQAMQPFMGYNQMNDDEEDDDDEEPDPILNDDSTDLNTISPFVLMENTPLIVKKNLVERKWFLMRGDKILGNYNSEQLLYFLTSQIQQGNKFEDMSINDHTTDLHFKPSILFEILRKYVPKLKKRYIKKVMEQNNEIIRKMQQQQQQMMQLSQINQINQLKMMQMNNQMNQMKMMQMNKNNMPDKMNNNQNNNMYNNNHGYNNNNYNNKNFSHNYNNKHYNNHGYNNMNYNQYQGGNYWNTNKKQK